MSSTDHVSDGDMNGSAVTVFRGRPLPMEAYLAGYSALIQAFDLSVPLPHTLSAVSPRNSRRKEDGWAIYPHALRPGSTITDHLTFALKYEGVELLALKKIFDKLRPAIIENAAKSKPTSAYVRRICFFYEWLTQKRLQILDTVAGAYVDAIDTNKQYASTDYGKSKRFRVRDNLPGTKDFCPLVYKTRALDIFIGTSIDTKARELVASAPRELIARAAAFLLLSDSKASFAIEGENPPRDRIARWGFVISKAGQLKLSTEELIRLQRELIGDQRFVTIGLRIEGGFVGRHDSFGQPEPEHISANAKDLHSLLNGMVQFDLMASLYDFHPVLSAACVAFGFVYIHPFEDGNGRIHRFLMHHVLAQRKFTPAEIVFPISSVILDDLSRYKDILESVSRPLLSLINWSSSEKGNVLVIQDTIDYYRYFDATSHCEYLFRCLSRAVEKDLPEELAFLEHRDAFHRSVTEVVDMGERTLDLLLMFLRQNHGKLSRRATSNEFAALSKSEIAEIETIYAEVFRY